MRGMVVARVRFLCAVVACMLSACAFDRPRPAAWGPLTPPGSADCREFAIAVYDMGEATNRTGRASLVGTLFGHAARESTAVRLSDRTSFAFLPEGALRVTLLREDRPAFVRETKDFACSEGQLVVTDGRIAAGAGVAAYETFVVTFRLDAEYLTARVEDSGIGLVGILPVLASETTWQRYRRVRD